MVWYPEGIAIILTLQNVQKKYKVTYASCAMTRFAVHKSDGTECMFKASKKGLYFADVKQDGSPHTP